MARVALERCRTAVCAVAAMGAMAEALGYYGAEDTPDERAALTVVDPTGRSSTCADDTGRGAVWAARRVPPTHVTAVANQFTIGALDEAALKPCRL